jgi:Na+/H+ antiporter NhaD/arsenite permease-like protein
LLAGAVLALAVTAALVAVRPRVGPLGRLHPVLATVPGLAGVAASGALGPADLVRAARDLWQPLVTIASIMSTTSVAHRLGLFERVSRIIELRARDLCPGRSRRSSS